jgi:hypothetical protein
MSKKWLSVLVYTLYLLTGLLVWFHLYNLVINFDGTIQAAAVVAVTMISVFVPGAIAIVLSLALLQDKLIRMLAIMTIVLFFTQWLYLNDSVMSPVNIYAIVYSSICVLTSLYFYTKLIFKSDH